MYGSVPETSFICDGLVDGGYYADPEAQCQVMYTNIFYFDRHFLYFIQHCFICPSPPPRPYTDSTVLEDAGIELRTVGTLSSAVRCYSYWRQLQEYRNGQGRRVPDPDPDLHEFALFRKLDLDPDPDAHLSETLDPDSN